MAIGYVVTTLTIKCDGCGTLLTINAHDEMTDYEIESRIKEPDNGWFWLDSDLQLCDRCKNEKGYE